MNKARTASIALALLAGATLLLSACGQRSSGSGTEGSGNLADAPLAGARIGGDFTLIDQDGRPRQWRDFAGQYRMVYFGYTYCPDVCPVDLQKIIAGLNRFARQDPARAARIQPIFISVDPERDTPAVLKPWVAAFHPRLIGLTGTPAEIDRVKKTFAVISGKAGDPGARKDYLVEHTRTPYLFGPDGAPIALVPVDAPGAGIDTASPEAMAQFFDQWVK